MGLVTVLLHVKRGDREEELPLVEHPPGGATNLGAFFAPKSDGDGLSCDNLVCANPACSTVFSVTCGTFIDRHRTAERQGAGMGKGVRPIVILTCEVCGTGRVIDETMFDDAARARWS